jgi:hypothetical protein
MVIVTITRCDLRDEFAMAAADEAFALSPISARATLPSEADYDAIREAFMETARGRWFLGEYGKRNRNADTSMVLDAVARIEATIAAQKQAPTNELPDTLVLIRGLLSDAKASAARTMSGSDAEEALAAVNKGTRIIREIAWTLREYGTDARICDMLDAQVKAIEASHQQTIAAEKRDAVLATFDLLIRRIGELGGSGAAASSPVSEAAASPFAGDEATAKTAEAAMTPGEGATTTYVSQVNDTAADDTPEATSSHSETAMAAATATSAEFARTEPLEADVATATDAETAALDLEAAEDMAAEDMAVLDVIALEMAEPEMAEPDYLAESGLTESGSAEPDLAEPGLAEPPPIIDTDIFASEIAEPVAPEPAMAESTTVEPDIVESDIVEPTTTTPPMVELAPEAAIVPEPEPVPEPEAPSLGASLIASGIVSGRSSGYDALAPLRRMSQAERIAFFS